jgi:hypothetical protein
MRDARANVHMTRRLINLLTAGSLLLCVAVCALWALSHHYDDEYQRAVGDRHCAVRSLRGLVSLSWTSADPAWREFRFTGRITHPVTGPACVAYAGLDDWCDHRLLGFGYSRNPIASGLILGTQTFTFLVAPHASLAAAFLALPAALLIASLGRRRRRPGTCRRCGYNLTGNVSGVCPECGRPTLRVGT